MPTMISIQVTQTQEENDNPTMAHPVLETFLAPQIPKKFLQSKFSWAKTEDEAPVSGPDFIQVPDHMRGNTKVQGYKKYITPAKSQGNKKKDKAIKSKKKTGPAKHPSFPKAKADCKETLQLAHTLRIKYLKASSI
jgi:hypothetical protein